jgi:hypothetical protein
MDQGPAAITCPDPRRPALPSLPRESSSSALGQKQTWAMVLGPIISTKASALLVFRNRHATYAHAEIDTLACAR